MQTTQGCAAAGRGRLTEFLGAGLGLQCGVSPSGLSLGVARRLERSGLSVDVLVDDGQGCAAVGDGEVGWGPEVTAYSGVGTPAQELTCTHVIQFGWVRDYSCTPAKCAYVSVMVRRVWRDGI
jgi:hypothetical protein